ncbi:diacylglycerol kinase family protein [uncultured Aquitalea sp.]|uniref:diacylglycerol/lipid kinase family protein n=1 Tax=uncultured Aquitalea sp. TaxID=540272 RepID=UPI0025DFCBB0|nr:diacylglycerol kinase family protein [uncultured Aquitalea sp.]
MNHPRLAFILHGQRCPRSLPNRLLETFSREFRVDIHITTSGSSAEELALAAVTQGCDFLVAVGGDGTIHEVINGVMRAPEALRERVAVGALPYGTGNDFVRSLGVSDSVSQLYRLVTDRQVRRIDLGKLTRADGTVMWFGNIASVGISSAIVERVKRLPRWLPAAVAFYFSIIATLLSYRARKMRLTLDGVAQPEESCVSLCVANGRYFGSGLGIAPMARLDDGLLEVVMIRNANSWDFIRFLPTLRKAQPVLHPKVRYLSGKVVELEAGASAVEVDGELAGQAPVRIEVAASALRCLSALV